MEPFASPAFKGLGRPGIPGHSEAREWAAPRLSEDRKKHRIFGFNNPNPRMAARTTATSCGWSSGGKSSQAEVPITNCRWVVCGHLVQGVENITPTWQQLVGGWPTASAAMPTIVTGRLNGAFPVPDEELILDLCAPMRVKSLSRRCPALSKVPGTFNSSSSSTTKWSDRTCAQPFRKAELALHVCLPSRTACRTGQALGIHT